MYGIFSESFIPRFSVDMESGRSGSLTWFSQKFFISFLFILPQEMNVFILMSRLVTEIVVFAIHTFLPTYDQLKHQ